MDQEAPRLALWGTFDVDNYGDHLFPLVARHELGRRLPGAIVDAYAPYGTPRPGRLTGHAGVSALGPWTRSRVQQLAGDYDTVVIGGGEIIHLNDPLLAPVYGVSTEEVCSLAPGRFFVEGLGADLERRSPAVWHAVGLPFELDDEQARRLKDALAGRPYLAVRDRFSLERLRRAGIDQPVEVVPDTALLLDRVLDRSLLQRRLAALRAGRLYPPGPALVIQGCDLLVPHIAAIAGALRAWLVQHPSITPVLVETGACRGDSDFADALEDRLGVGVVRLPPAEMVEDIAAAIAGAWAFVGSSLHGAITALVYGRPFVLLNLAGEAKLDGFADLTGLQGRVLQHLDHLDHLAPRLDEAVAHPVVDGLLERLQERVDTHFDRLAEVATVAARRRVSIQTRPLVGVVVVSYGGDHHTVECLERLHCLTWPAERLELVLVDNGPEGSVGDLVARRWPAVAVIRQHANLGFGAACNAGFRRLGHVDYVAILNNDTLPDRSFLEALVESLESEPGLGAVNPKVLLRHRYATVSVRSASSMAGPHDRRRLGVQISGLEVDGTDVFAACYPVRGTWGRETDPDALGAFQWTDGLGVLHVPVPEAGAAGPVRIRLSCGLGPRAAVLHSAAGEVHVLLTAAPTWVELPGLGDGADVVNNVGIALEHHGEASDRGFLEVDDGRYDTRSQIFAWSAAAVLLRTAFLDDVGGFEDELFLYYEDVDLAWRGRHRGWTYRVEPSSVVRHIHGATTLPLWPLVRHLSERNRLLVLTRNAPAGLAMVALGHAGSVIGLAVWHDVLVRFATGRRAEWGHVAAQVRVLGGYAKRLPRALAQRRRIREGSKFDDAELRAWLDDPAPLGGGSDGLPTGRLSGALERELEPHALALVVEPHAPGGSGGGNDGQASTSLGPRRDLQEELR
ncbi:MAG: polysaccharide pyruvyl transferase family protein [Acidimicrobiia bacterium]